MKEHFQPNGGGDDDFDWNHSHPEIWLSYVIVDDQGDGEDLCEPLPTELEKMEQSCA